MNSMLANPRVAMKGHAQRTRTLRRQEAETKGDYENEEGRQHLGYITLKAWLHARLGWAGLGLLG